eukprot:864998-Amphidinium_carterae.1
MRRGRLPTVGVHNCALTQQSTSWRKVSAPPPSQRHSDGLVGDTPAFTSHVPDQHIGKAL